MTREELVFRAALARFVFAAAALGIFPMLYPAFGRSWPVLAVYLVIAGVEQLLIRKRIGGIVRSLVAGIVDAAVLAYCLHRLGASTSPLASVYVFAAIANALVVGLRVGIALAVLDALAFSGVVWLEHYRVLSFAPDVPELAALGPPTAAQSITASIMLAVILIASTTVVGLLTRALRGREAELERANEKLVILSQRDPLTSLWNRRHLLERIEHELARVRRGRALSVVMLDLDRFKRVNDTEGHLRGDVLLCEIAEALAQTTRVTDVAGRYGGDEFAVLLPDTDVEQARGVAERIAAGVRAVGGRFDAAHAVTASVGVAEAVGSDSAATLLRRADENAYRAKVAGGDRVVG